VSYTTGEIKSDRAEPGCLAKASEQQGTGGTQRKKSIHQKETRKKVMKYRIRKIGPEKEAGNSWGERQHLAEKKVMGLPKNKEGYGGIPTEDSSSSLRSAAGGDKLFKKKEQR